MLHGALCVHVGADGLKRRAAHAAHVVGAVPEQWQRDQNSALVVLIDAHNAQDTPGMGVAARPKPLPRQRGKSKSVTRETPATIAQAV